MSDTAWSDPTRVFYDVAITEFEIVLEHIEETCVLREWRSDEYRPAEPDDLNVHDYADYLIETFADMLIDEFGLSLPSYRRAVEPLMLALVTEIAQGHLDWTDAAWQPTGRYRLVTTSPDGITWREGGSDEV